MTVFGALKIDKSAAMEIGDPEAKGLTYKKYVDRLNDKENKANKKLAKANEELQDLKVNTPFDRLKLNSLQSIIQGADQKLQQFAALKMNAAGVQNAYNETADELGLDADALAKGKVKAAKSSDMAKYGKELEKAQPGLNVTGSTKTIETEYTDSAGSDGKKSRGKKKTTAGKKKSNEPRINIKPSDYPDITTPPLIGVEDTPVQKSTLEELTEMGLGPIANAPAHMRDDFATQSGYENLSASEKAKFDLGVKNARKKIAEDAAAKAARDEARERNKELLKTLSPQLANLLRRPLQEDLRGDQLYAEMMAKAQNQVEPVQAQTFQPLLDQPYQVSFQDQLNQNQASFNALLRTPGVANNPAAQSALAAQKYEADKNVLANQFRTNQGIIAETINKNRGTLNEAQLKNLAILDQQYTRQAEALSKTKATDLEIAKSISDKIAKNRLENRTFAAYSNMFPQYGFNRNMMAVSQLPTFFNTGNVPGLSPEDAKEFQEWYDQKNKAKTTSTTKPSTTGKYGKELKKHFKNGNIVKSFKG
jgi:hypothetical protein